MKKRSLLTSFLCLLLVMVSGCEKEEFFNSFVVSNNSEEPIVVILHANYPDTLAVVAVSNGEKLPSEIVPPKSTLDFRYHGGDKKIQMSIFSYSDYEKSGGFENLHYFHPLVRYEVTEHLLQIHLIFYPADTPPDDPTLKRYYGLWMMEGFHLSPKGWMGQPESEWPEWFKVEQGK